MLTSCQFVSSGNGESRQKTAAEWQAMARAELDATHALVLHPQEQRGRQRHRDRIFDATTGGLEFDRTDMERLPRTYAQWRVSDVAIAKMAQHEAANFGGRVAIVTDTGCASACLNFADLVRSVPGSVHLGQATSADTVYMDIGHAKLPNGNKVIIPTKVWRNRVRGNNEVLTPDIPLHVNMRDDAAVQSAALAAVKVH